MSEAICAPVITSGVQRGRTATGTWAGYMRHRRAGEPACDACLAALRADYRQRMVANPEAVRDRRRRYRAANPEKKKSADERYRRSNPERVRQSTRAWRGKETTKAKEAEYARRWKAANREKARANFARWQSSHPEQNRERERRRRARKATVVSIDFTPEQLDARMAMFGHRCWMCGGPYEHVDHVIAIARGGPHVLANLRPACQSCNSSKKDGDWHELM